MATENNNTVTTITSTTPNITPKDPPKPIEEETTSSTIIPQNPPIISPSPIPETPVTLISQPPEQPVIIPSYSRWFSWNEIHECEGRFLPEFFDQRAPSKSPKVYKYYRNSIIGRFRKHPTRKITFTEVRKTTIGDVGSIRRVFDFLDAWGLINYLPSQSKPQLKWEEKESKSNSSATPNNDSGVGTIDFTMPKNRLCSGCKTPCSIACFACDKHDLTLCARCYVRGNYRVGVNSSEFRRVEISEEVKSDWTDKETLRLLEAIMHYGEEWTKVAEHVGGRSEKECVNRFIKLPFGEQFDVKFDETKDENDVQPSPTKKTCLTPLADASNPIMAQAAFLSALVGVDVAEAAASAAVKSIAEENNGARHRESDVINATNTVEVASLEARSQLEKEEHDLEKSISDIIEVQAKEIQEKIIHFEEFDYQMEKDRQQLQQMKNMLFVDQLTLLFDEAANAPRTQDNMVENPKIEL